MPRIYFPFPVLSSPPSAPPPLCFPLPLPSASPFPSAQDSPQCFPSPQCSPPFCPGFAQCFPIPPCPGSSPVLLLHSPVPRINPLPTSVPQCPGCIPPPFPSAQGYPRPPRMLPCAQDVFPLPTTVPRINTSFHGYTLKCFLPSVAPPLPSAQGNSPSVSPPPRVSPLSPGV